ncbi:MAG: hypothetical protein AAGA90_22540, partial [Actinomycetota bacterium]
GGGGPTDVFAPVWDPGPMVIFAMVAFAAFGGLIAWAWRYAGDHAAPGRSPSNDAHGGWRNMHDGGW